MELSRFALFGFLLIGTGRHWMSTEKKSPGIFAKGTLWGVLFTAGIMVGLIADVSRAAESTKEKGDFFSDVQLLDGVMSKIHQKYVEEVNSSDLVDQAVNGMLSILDPHTSFLKPKDYEELMIHTQGKFGGLGIQIAISEKVLTVMTPIPGTPAERAGIQTGDRIIKIDGKSTQGITVDKAVEKLRGEPGTSVVITILRKGERAPFEVPLVRDVIVIRSVPFSGMLENGVGYVRLNSFSKETADEMETAIDGLLKSGARGIIFDMRHNPGGLLTQAQEVSGKFLPRGSLVVSTRGRVYPPNDDFTMRTPQVPDSVRVVVLVDEASASAAEIVSGAIQDNDRGIILGDTTFGKGSVQSIEPLRVSDGKDYSLKITEAFYYTPSGRCINKPENGIRGVKNNDDDAIDNGSGDALSESFSGDSAVSAKKDSSKAAAKKDTLVYHTKNGRVVYGGGGIIPDTIVKLPLFTPVVRALKIKDVFFRFAANEYPALTAKGVKVDGTFKIDDAVMKDFNAFLDSTRFDFRPFASVKYDEFRKWAGLLADTTADSIRYSFDRPEWTKDEKAELEKLSSRVSDLLTLEGRRELTQHGDEVKRYIREAMLVRALGQDNETVHRARLAVDAQVKAAIGILGDKAAYDRLLKPPTKK